MRVGTISVLKDHWLADGDSYSTAQKGVGILLESQRPQCIGHHQIYFFKMAVPQFSHGDRTMLEGLASVHRAVDSASVRRACEQFRDALLHQRDCLAIGAEALSLFLQTRTDSIRFDLATTEWTQFFCLAKDIDNIEERDDHRRPRRGDSSARTASLRHLRATARLTAFWGLQVLEHYGFTHWNPKKVECLAKCAGTLRNFSDFVHIANCVLLQRHESSLASNRIDRIGQHTSANQHASANTVPRSDQPLQTKDVTRILNLILGTEIVTLGERKFKSYEQLLGDRSRVDEWVQDETGNVRVAGKAVKDYDRFRSANYHLQYDQYGTLVPREQRNNLQPRDLRQRKRQRLEDISVATRADDDVSRTVLLAREWDDPAVVHLPTPSPARSAGPGLDRRLNGVSCQKVLGTCVPQIDGLGPKVTEFPGTERVNPSTSTCLSPITAPITYISPDREVREAIPAYTEMSTSSLDLLEARSLSKTNSPLNLDQSSRDSQCESTSSSADSFSRSTSPSTERQPLTLPRGAVPPAIPDASVSGVRHSSINHETMSPFPGLEPDRPMTSEFDEQFASHMACFTPADEASKIFPLQRSLVSNDLHKHALFDLADVSPRSSSVSSSPDSFSSLLHISSSGSPVIGASPCPESPWSDHSSPVLMESMVASTLDLPRVSLADAWLRLPELQRQERVDPFAKDDGNDRVYVATPEQIQAAVVSGFKFKKPIVTTYKFLDSHIHTPEKFVSDLRRFYSRDGCRFRLCDGQVRSITADQLVKIMKDPAKEPPGVLEISSLSKSHIAPFLLNCRFRLFDALSERTKQDSGIWKRSNGVTSSDVNPMQFSTLGFPGVFQQPYIDNMVGSQMRVLFGKQRSVIVPYDELTGKERAEFAAAGRQWCPPLDKGQVIPLESNDVVLVPPGVRVIRAVFTDELCLTEGGCVWDFLAVKEILSGLLHVLQHRERACGPATIFPTQLLDELETWISEEPGIFTEGNREQFQHDVWSALEQLRSTRCTCVKCKPGDCSCERSSRRCTEWCHSFVIGNDCMLGGRQL
jgi:hypothetical protein